LAGRSDERLDGSLEGVRCIWLTAIMLLGPEGAASSSAKPYEVRCKEPLPVFTLGEKSNPTSAQEATLCKCIWDNLGSWERRTSEKIAAGKESEEYRHCTYVRFPLALVAP
jgi:hypothetical protein